MNFFDLRNGIIAGGNLKSSGKYELKGGEKTYPTYSAQAINAATLDVLNGSEPPVRNLLEAYKATFDHLVLPAVKRANGKNLEISSVAGYQKALIEANNILDNLVWHIDFHCTNTENSVVVERTNSLYNLFVDWGDGNTSIVTDPGENDQLNHIYAKLGDYHIIAKLIIPSEESQSVFDVINNIDNGFIRVLTVDAGTFNIQWPFLYAFNCDDGNDNVIGYTLVYKSNGNNFNQMQQPFSTTPQIWHFGSEELPCWIGDITSIPISYSGQDVLKEATIQVIGADFSGYDSAYPALTTLKVAPDDLNTFKTAVTAFNNGNTTATLTVLKGKNQEEAYQWATANGHFASIVKEQ